MKFIIVLGDPVQGYQFIGPFDSALLASTWADKMRLKETFDWTCAILNAPRGVD